MKIKNEYSIKVKVWLYSGESAWHFVSVPKKESKEIKKMFGVVARGWGSLPVVVTIGKTSWKTSIFPDNKTKTYLLPLKALVRKAENIQAGQIINVHFKIMY